MKNHAHAMLLLSGHPLEPIVALEVQKSLQAKQAATILATASATPIYTSYLYNVQEMEERWFSQYE